MGPGGTRALVAALLLAVSASGCIGVDASLDALALHLEENIPHSHGPAAVRPAPPARHAVHVPRSTASIRGTLLVGLAVRESEASSPSPRTPVATASPR